MNLVRHSINKFVFTILFFTFVLLQAKAQAGLFDNKKKPKINLFPQIWETTKIDDSNPIGSVVSIDGYEFITKQDLLRANDNFEKLENKDQTKVLAKLVIDKLWMMEISRIEQKNKQYFISNIEKRNELLSNIFDMYVKYEILKLSAEDIEKLSKPTQNIIAELRQIAVGTKTSEEKIKIFSSVKITDEARQIITERMKKSGLTRNQFDKERYYEIVKSDILKKLSNANREIINLETFIFSPSAMPIPLDIPPTKSEIENTYYKYAGALKGEGKWDKYENYEYLEMSFDFVKDTDNKALSKLITISLQSQFKNESKLSEINSALQSISSVVSSESPLHGIYNLRSYITYFEKVILEKIKIDSQDQSTFDLDGELVKNIKDVSNYETAAIEYFAKSPLKVTLQSDYFFDLISGTHQEGAFQIVKSQFSDTNSLEFKAAKIGLVRAIKAFYGNYYIADWKNCLKMLFDEAYKIASNQNGLTDENKTKIQNSYKLSYEKLIQKTGLSVLENAINKVDALNSMEEYVRYVSELESLFEQTQYSFMRARVVELKTIFDVNVITKITKELNNEFSKVNKSEIIDLNLKIKRHLTNAYFFELSQVKNKKNAKIVSGYKSTDEFKAYSSIKSQWGDVMNLILKQANINDKLPNQVHDVLFNSRAKTLKMLDNEILIKPLQGFGEKYRLPLENKDVQGEVSRILAAEKVYSINKKLLNGWGYAKINSHTVYPLDNEFGLYLNNDLILDLLAQDLEIKK